MEISLKDKVNGFKIFTGFSSSQIDKILSLGHLVEFDRGDVIVEADTKLVDTYIILEGKLEASMGTTSSEMLLGKLIHIETRKAGDIFGATTFEQERRTLLRLTAVDKMLVIRIDRKELYQLLNSDNNLGYLLMQNIALILDQRLIDYCFRIREI